MTAVPRQAPFVGLRPFEEEDSHLFFGRREQLGELLQRLHDHRLVAVVGSSGCGKSSLVRAGLVPALKAGFLVRSRAAWRVLVIKPGKAPMRHLAEAVLSGDSDEEAGAEEAAEEAGALSQAASLCGAEPVVERLGRGLGAGEGEHNVLLVVDQFEELFRFGLHARNRRLRDEAADFVSVLLELVEESSLPVYVVLTMRADFIRDCDDVPDLPEALNRSLFLVPRLTREQFREAIEGPARWADAEISGRLLDRLLNDSSREHDELPVLQHALLQTWREWAKDRRGPLDLPDYERSGTAERALDLDAERALEGLGEAEMDRVRRLFQALTAVDPSNRKIRRPARPSELEHVTGVPRDEVRTLLERFRSDERSLLVWSDDEDDPLVDISHESLIRNWRRLDAWAEEEAESVDLYRDLARAADDYPDRGGLLQDPKLQIYLDWRERRRPTRAWSERVAPEADFEGAMGFLDKSRRARDEERARREREREEAHEGERREARERLRRARRLLAASAGVLVLLVGLSVYALKAEQDADALRAYHELTTGAWTSLQDYPPRSLLLASSALSIDLSSYEVPRSEPADLSSAQRVFLRALSSAGGRPVASGTGSLTALTLTSDGRGLVAAVVPPQEEVGPTESYLLCWTQPSAVDEWKLVESFTVPEIKAMTAIGARLAVAATEQAKIWFFALGRDGCPAPESSSSVTVDSRITSLHADSGGRWLAALAANELTLWDLHDVGGTGPESRKRPLDLDRVEALALDRVEALALGGGRDAPWLAIGDTSGKVEIRRLGEDDNPSSSEEELLKGAPIETLAAGAGLDRLVVTRANAQVTVFDLSESPPTLEIDFQGERRFMGAEMSPGSERLVTWDRDGSIELWALVKGEDKSDVRGDLPKLSDFPVSGRHGLRSGAFSPDGEWLFTGHDLANEGTRQWEIRRWNLGAIDPGKEISVLQVPETRRSFKKAIRRMAFSPDRNRALVLDRSGHLGLWCLCSDNWCPGAKSPERVCSQDLQPVAQKTWVPDRGEPKVHAAAFSGNGGVIVSRKDGSVETLALSGEPGGSAGEMNFEIRLPDEFGPPALAVSRNGRLVVAMNREGEIVVRGEREAVFTLDRPALAAAFTPDGRRLIAATDGTKEPIRIHDFESRAVEEISCGDRNCGTIQALDVSPDGQRLVAGDADGVVRFWDLSNDQGVYRDELNIAVEEEPIVAVAFTPNGEDVLVTTESGLTRRWPVLREDRYCLARELVGEGPVPRELWDPERPRLELFTELIRGERDRASPEDAASACIAESRQARVPAGREANEVNGRRHPNGEPLPKENAQVGGRPR